MSGVAGWKNPPLGVPAEPDPARPYVSLSEAAKQLGLDRRTLFGALASGTTPGWARPVPTICGGSSTATLSRAARGADARAR